MQRHPHFAAGLPGLNVNVERLGCHEGAWFARQRRGNWSFEGRGSRGSLGSGGSGGARPYRYDRRRPDPLRYALHDRLGPGLAHLQLRLELLATAEPPSGLARTQLRSLQHEVSGLVRELGRIVHAEPPELLADRGLVAAIRVATAPSALAPPSGSVAAPSLPSAVSELLYRAA